MHKILITTALLLVFGTSAYMSIYGLAAVFLGAGLVVIFMGAGMELGKILTVIHLHRHWRSTGFLARCLMIFVVAALTMITSAEILGYLSQRHATAERSMKTAETALMSLEHETGLIRARMLTLEDTLAGLPASFVTRRIQERKKAGYDQMQARLLKISREQAELRAERIADRAYAGPIFATARIFKIDEAGAVSLFILILVAVLEPLSIGLAVATSAAWPARSPKLKAESTEEAAGRPHRPYGRPQPTIMQKPAEAAEALQKPAEAAHPLTVELQGIKKRHNLKIEDIIRIAGRKQPETVEDWLNGSPVIPIKAMRSIRQWAKQHPAIRMVETKPK